MLIPVAAIAATAATGQLIETTNYSSKNATSYINLAQCQTGALSLEWNLLLVPGVTFTGGSYSVFASDTQPTQATGTNGIYCAQQDAPSAVPPIHAGQVGNSITTNLNILMDVQGAPGSGNVAVTKAGKSCSADGQQIWICAHWSDQTGTKNGSAFGKFTLQFTAPDAPANLGVGAGDSKLIVRWDAVTTGAAPADHYIAQAFVPPRAPPDAPDFTSSSVTGTTVTITGLTNGTAYDVYVVPFSIGGNAGTAAGPVLGTPLPSASFWDVYKDRGGVEQGGCASGSGGILALLAVASLAALRRRKP